jgi:tetratricopeptide (TPR) repeat protein
MDSKRYDEAITEWNQVRELEPNNIGIYNELGICYKNKGLFDKAIAAYKVAILQDPKDPVYHANLARTYYLKGLLKDGIKEFKLTIELGGGSAWIHYVLGHLYAEISMFQKALKEFQKAVKLDPSRQIYKDNFMAMQAIMESQREGRSDDVRIRIRRLKVPDERSEEVTVMKGQVNKAESTIEKWFEELRGEVIGELAFIDKTTFGYLDSIPMSCGLRLIVSNTKDEEVCLEKARKCSRNRPYVEIIRIPKIHKRWVGSKQNFIIDIGADLKADALGRSTHTIRKIQSEECLKETEQFEKLWKTSEEELKHNYGQNNISKSMFFSTSRTNMGNN